MPLEPAADTVHILSRSPKTSKNSFARAAAPDIPPSPVQFEKRDFVVYPAQSRKRRYRRKSLPAAAPSGRGINSEKFIPRGAKGQADTRYKSIPAVMMAFANLSDGGNFASDTEYYRNKPEIRLVTTVR